MMATARELFGLATLMCSKCGESFPVGARQHKRCRRMLARMRPLNCAVCGDDFFSTKRVFRKGKYRDAKVRWPGTAIASHKLAHVLADDAAETA